MVTIRRVDVLPFAIPLRRPLATARGTLVRRRGAIVRLHADGGLVGLGEASPHPAAPPHAVGQTRAALARARCWLLGADVTRLRTLLAVAARLDRPAAAGLDIALHDLAARAAGCSVAELLGGVRRAAVPASVLLTADEPAACAAEAAAAAAAGFRCAKLKVDRDLAAAAARVDAVRCAAPALALRADANGGLDAGAAIALGRRLAPLEWLEQPVGDVAGLARVRAAGVPVAVDESVDSADAVTRLAGAGAADVIVLKLVQLGGLAPARLAAAAAREAGLAVTVTTAIDGGVATAAALHLAAALPDPLRACGLVTTSLLGGDVLRTPLSTAPVLRPPDGPGLGVALDEQALARWRDEEAT